LVNQRESVCGRSEIGIERVCARNKERCREKVYEKKREVQRQSVCARNKERGRDRVYEK
jgi:hypothetical protein